MHNLKKIASRGGLFFVKNQDKYDISMSNMTSLLILG